MASSDRALMLTELFNVSNKVALVTGGGTGIGKMITSGLAANGAKGSTSFFYCDSLCLTSMGKLSKEIAKVFITSRKVSNLKSTADEINAKYPGSVVYIVSDISTRSGVEDLIGELKKHTCKLHILINNSAMTWADPIDTFNEKSGWDRLYAVNVKAPFFLSVLMAPLLTESSSGNIDPARIINISSIGTLMYDARAGAFFRPGCGIWSYCTSKAALNHLTMLLANEYVKQHINVNTVMPGVFLSRMTRRGIQHWPEKMKAMVPNGRYGNAGDITGTVVFLCSKASSHVTGATIIVDGGTHIGSAIQA